MTAAYLDKQPHLYEKWSGLNPLGRLGRPDELRGVVTWLASDASSLEASGSFLFFFYPNIVLSALQYSRERWTSRVVRVTCKITMCNVTSYYKWNDLDQRSRVTADCRKCAAGSSLRLTMD